jgi:formylglycine-generating enzyme required for sulfatase activity
LTGKEYRLLSDAEYEYAARGGTRTKYPWGNDVQLNGEAMANCSECGSKWDDKQSAPVGSFAPHGFGLHDMIGNVAEWTEDCYHGGYEPGRPDDGAPWTNGDCNQRVARGGSWMEAAEMSRSAIRLPVTSSEPSFQLGFRVARTLSVGVGATTVPSAAK